MINSKSGKPANYYLLLQKQLKQQYGNLEKSEINTLSREIIFAPDKYTVRLKEKDIPVTALRESTADFIERNSSEKASVPYSLDAEIADLIELNNCETSSMNEYYRWISTTAEIIRNSGDGEITEQDVSDRNSFITHSFDREAEILLCLSLYEGSGNPKNRAKMDLLRFKLARLREMRSIVRNTPALSNTNDLKEKEREEKRRRCYHYCKQLLAQKINSADFNSKLKLDINNIDEDLEEDFSYMDNIRIMILEMMRDAEENSAENYRAQNAETYEQTPADMQNLNFLSSARQNEGR